jgi:hypothetical protein
MYYLEKIVKYAIEQGFKWENLKTVQITGTVKDYIIEQGVTYLFLANDDKINLHINDIIFDHNFAKCLYGKNWKHHLQLQAVNKRMLYIVDFLKTKGVEFK